MIITNGTLITWQMENLILEGMAMRIADGRIVEIAPQRELLDRYPQEERLDAEGQYVMPGNLCAHTHFYGAFARGMAIPGAAPKDFPQILQKLWWPLDRSLTLEDVRLSTQVMLADAIRHGTTMLIDHHASPNAIEGSLDVIAEEVEKAGLRAVLCYEVSDRDGPEKTQAGIEENLRFLKACEGGKRPLVRASFGLHASLTLSDRTLERCRAAVPEGVGFHLHVAESEADEYDSLAKWGLRVVDRLHRHGILGRNTILAHCVHVDAREMEILAESGSWVTHQPRSNMNNAVGVAPVESLLRIGVPVCLGTDGFPSTMWVEWKFAYLVQKVWHRDPRRMPANLIADMAIYNNAALAGRFFTEAPLGVLQEGAFADLILVDYHPHTPLTAENLPWHIVFGFHESMVTTTIVNGRVLMKDRRILTLDEAAVAARAREFAPRTWQRYQAHVLGNEESSEL
ncbi:MAG: putative aminohydrolase SsnA [Anaerolineales bacterium]|nr:putative aminohydrolase SsnA [Anaerolineales bacterium]MCS7248349.1 putative aminohydrolase SsnA [Anaerolineales bacterium]MDW8162162.1 putative aminohydrolase SsnA [Anaerolineales bacterium]MDW8446717.1 putative aminohydrolase SsnA [Anaerolineales bacterium]